MSAARLAASLAAAAALAAPAAAQVGHMPASSPFRDLAYRQELSIFAGRFGGGVGAAGVGPQAGPMVGVRYEIRIGGPAEFTVRLAQAFSKRTVIDPTKPAATRRTGTVDIPIAIGDVGLTINLTGQKSFHNIVPVLNGGIGIASSLGKAEDPSGFRFGTPFAFSFGGGVRWTPGGPFQLRADVADYLYQLTYPDSYFTAPSGVTPVLAGTSSRSEYKHNTVLTVGVSFLYSR